MESSNKFTVLHRILHWVMVLAMPILYLTGFLRTQWMSRHNLAGAIERNAGSVLSKEQLSKIARDIREPMWEWHEVFAHIMIISFGIRVIYMIVKGIRFQNPFKRELSLKERLQGFSYVYFYLYLVVAIFTGICLEKDFFSAWHRQLEEVHKLGLYLFPMFILLHFTGIVIAEHTNQKGVVSKMIGGES